MAWCHRCKSTNHRLDDRCPTIEASFTKSSMFEVEHPNSLNITAPASQSKRSDPHSHPLTLDHSCDTTTGSATGSATGSHSVPGSFGRSSCATASPRRFSHSSGPGRLSNCCGAFLRAFKRGAFLRSGPHNVRLKRLSFNGRRWPKSLSTPRSSFSLKG